MDQKQVKIGEHDYRIGRLNPRKQLHLVRRLAPVIGGLVKEARGKSAADLAKAEEGEILLMMFGPIADALSQMKEADVDYVIDLCLDVVSRKEGEQWQPVVNPTTRGMQYADIDMPELVQLCGQVVAANLGNFLPGQLRK